MAQVGTISAAVPAHGVVAELIALTTFNHI